MILLFLYMYTICLGKRRTVQMLAFDKGRAFILNLFILKKFSTVYIDYISELSYFKCQSGNVEE